MFYREETVLWKNQLTMLNNYPAKTDLVMF
ncbi:hypothetical protein HMPREF1071_02510 [Bacteroides salyersiae CL02T12C01]|uniref:Uncharacterized protein n=1 Tax=Bacteroides salyersiae CL02T12C01 TaxID=997887 RepID=I8YGZ1_9BACE|nr:hypothetical protein HMPREF1071_02510 [Bacteroides salyersiae CL02T12C01]